MQSSDALFTDPGKPDGAGATSGVKTGGFGFHTEEEFAPWWMLDLGAVHEIGTIRVFNRQDAAAERAQTLCVSLAWNAAGPWVEVYKSAGVFGGVRTGDPLTITLEPRLAARFVRLHLTERTMLHLDEVEVYAGQAGDAFEAGQPELVFPFERATMEYPSEDGGPGSWEDIWKWILFQSKYGLDLPAVLNPPYGQARPVLSLGGPHGFDGAVKILRILRYARFGNNFYQILNGAMIARAMKCSVLQLPEIDHPPDNLPIRVDAMEIQSFSHDLPDGPALAAQFYVPTGFESLLGPHDAEFALDTLARFVKPVYQNFLAAAGSLDGQTMAMHFRGGDVFRNDGADASHFVHPDYVQPPASYYIRALEYGMRRLGITAVHLVYEDKKNPAVDILIAHLTAIGITFSEQSAALLDDVVSLMSAHHLVAATGTFCEAIALLSPVTRSYFAFRRLSSQWMLGDFWAQCRVADLLRGKGVDVFVIDDPDASYIKPHGWEGATAQLEMIRDYPARKLRLMLLQGKDTRPEAGPGHSDVARTDQG